MSTPFSLPGLVADAFYLLSHDHHSGRPYLDEDGDAVSLGAAILTEMIVSGYLRVNQDRRVEVPRGVATPRDLTQHAVLDQVTAERKARRLGEWMEFLGPTVRPMIANRLVQQRFLVPIEPTRIRLPGRYYITTPPRWETTDPLKAEAPKLHLNVLISATGVQWEAYDLLLLALACAAGLQHRIFPFVDGHFIERVKREASDQLGYPIPDLLHQLATTTTGLVAAGRH
jgi:hypothetical protein